VWHTIWLSALAGLMGANAVPQLIKGMVGEQFPNVWGNDSLRNAMAGTLGFAACGRCANPWLAVWTCRLRRGESFFCTKLSSYLQIHGSTSRRSAVSRKGHIRGSGRLSLRVPDNDLDRRWLGIRGAVRAPSLGGCGCGIHQAARRGHDPGRPQAVVAAEVTTGAGRRSPAPSAVPPASCRRVRRPRAT
jgi:hypothetical protein